jgi:4-amino-4-deoxychorismate lyase
VEGALRRADAGDLILIETFRWEPGEGFARLPAHLGRLARGAAALGVPLDRAAVDRALAGVGGEGPLRVRLTLDRAGAVAVTAAPLAPGPAVWSVRIAGERLASGDPWLGLKSSRRPAHDAARAALPPGVDEALLLNERDEVCEGTITSVFADLGRGLLTPPLACGLLPGVLRAELLAAGDCGEAVLRPGDLVGARLFVGNALRGLIPARLAEG